MRKIIIISLIAVLCILIFVGFVDGIGWYVRRGDLKRMVGVYDFVFTFSRDELEKFENLLMETFYGK